MSLTDHLAHGPKRHMIETVIRMQSVKRWHMHDTTRQQTIAEHSLNVGMLAMAIAMVSPMFIFDSPKLLAVAGMVHDAPEVFTGDMPTHTKKSVTGLDELEDSLLHPVFHVVINEHSKMLLKMCDLADGVRFIRLHGAGKVAEHACINLGTILLGKFEEARIELMWMDNLLEIVRDNIMFYAYEN